MDRIHLLALGLADDVMSGLPLDRQQPDRRWLVGADRILEICARGVSIRVDLAVRRHSWITCPRVRGNDGSARAMSDVCVHRGPALSLGTVSNDEIVCAYHGWRYAADGKRVAIPQLADPARVPAKARIAAFRTQERYGLVPSTWLLSCI